MSNKNTTIENYIPTSKQRNNFICKLIDDTNFTMKYEKELLFKMIESLNLHPALVKEIKLRIEVKAFANKDQDSKILRPPVLT